MKQRNQIICALLSASLLLGSCKKDYLEATPTTSIAASDAFSTTVNAWAALNGIHRSLYIQYYSNQDQGGQSANMIYMDMLGEDLVNTTQGNGWFIATYRWLAHRNATGTIPYFNYRFYYTIVANANMIIDNIDGASGPQADKDIIKGQALAYRAWSYYQMIQLFGKRYDAAGPNNTEGLPLILSSADVTKPRSTVAEVYTQINADLDQAITLLTGKPARANKSHINLGVAQGFKARVALTQQNWQVAATMAAAARTGYSPMSNAQYMAGFNDYTNPEWMWGVRQVSDQTTYFYSFFAYMSADYNSTNIRTNPKAINSKLYEQIGATDIRKSLWDPTGTNTEFPVPKSNGSEVGVRMPYIQRKFLSAGGSLSSIGDVVLMRASEMYLIEAEAKARLNDGTAANVLFQLVSKRDPAYVQSTLTGQDLIDHILVQRRIELWGEGFRFYDLKRLNQSLDRRGANHDPAVATVLTVPAGDEQWQFLIPQDEINFTNGVVKQNPL
jgi:starch-binding outer membrane protein, SusD/RagB family